MIPALLLRYWPQLVAGLVIAAALAWFASWIGGLRDQIHQAQSQRNAVIAFAIQQQTDLSIARVNVITLEGAIARQNDAIGQLHDAGVRASREAALGLARAAERHRIDEARLAAVRAPLRATTTCARSDEAAARAREALR